MPRRPWSKRWRRSASAGRSRCLEPPPDDRERRRRRGAPPRARARTRARRRAHVGEHGRLRSSTRPAPLVPRGLAAVERKDLGRVQQPLGVEHRLDAHLHGEVGLGELDAHEVALLDADAVLAGEAAARGHAQLEDLVARLLGPLGLGRIVGVVEDQRVQVAVAGVEDVGDAQAVPVADVRDGDQHLAQLAERDHAVHAVVVGDAADGAERGLAALPDGGALLRALADAQALGAKRLGDVAR